MFYLRPIEKVKAVDIYKILQVVLRTGDTRVEVTLVGLTRPIR